MRKHQYAGIRTIVRLVDWYVEYFRNIDFIKLMVSYKLGTVRENFEKLQN